MSKLPKNFPKWLRDKAITASKNLLQELIATNNAKAKKWALKKQIRLFSKQIRLFFKVKLEKANTWRFAMDLYADTRYLAIDLYADTRYLAIDLYANTWCFSC